MGKTLRRLLVRYRGTYATYATYARGRSRRAAQEPPALPVIPMEAPAPDDTADPGLTMVATAIQLRR